MESATVIESSEEFTEVSSAAMSEALAEFDGRPLHHLSVQLAVHETSIEKQEEIEKPAEAQVAILSKQEGTYEVLVQLGAHGAGGTGGLSERENLIAAVYSVYIGVSSAQHAVDQSGAIQVPIQLFPLSSFNGEGFFFQSFFSYCRCTCMHIH